MEEAAVVHQGHHPAEDTTPTGRHGDVGALRWTEQNTEEVLRLDGGPPSCRTMSLNSPLRTTQLAKGPGPARTKTNICFDVKTVGHEQHRPEGAGHVWS